MAQTSFHAMANMKIFNTPRWGMAAITLLFLCGCANRFTISIAGISTADQIPENGQVHGYRNLPEVDRHLGPYYVLHIASEDDVSKLATEFTHHLYFSLIPCSQTEHGYDLWSGGVFTDSGEMAATNAASSTTRNVNRYRIHIPVQANAIIRHVHGIGALDADRYLGRASKEDLCVRMGGGQMWGTSLFSNSVKTPLHFDGKAGFSITP